MYFPFEYLNKIRYHSKGGGGGERGELRRKYPYNCRVRELGMKANGLFGGHKPKNRIEHIKGFYISTGWSNLCTMVKSFDP